MKDITEIIKKSFISKFEFDIIARDLTIEFTRDDNNQVISIGFLGIHDIHVFFDSEEIDDCLYIPDVQIEVLENDKLEKASLGRMPNGSSLLCLDMDGDVLIRIIFKEYLVY
jgi:hypothetical protein